MAYGSVAGVAALARRYTDAGSFSTTTRPTSDQVSAFLDQVSATLDVYLAGAGFVVPMTDANALLMLAGLANSYAADMVQAANSAGRFYTEERLKGKAPFTVISMELGQWVKANAYGLEQAGADRNASPGYWVDARLEDESGNTINPIFKRDDFGNKFD